MQHKIKEIEDYQLVYDDRSKDFKLLDAEGDEQASGKNQDEVEKKVEELKKSNFKFPIRVYHDTGFTIELGRLTSLNVTDRSIRYVPDDTRGQSKFKKHLNHTRLFEITDANRSLAQDIQAKKKHVDEVQDEIKALREKMEKPINPEYFGIEPKRY